jgi:hypothetical protein
MADTMIGFHDNSLSTNFLTEEEIRKTCPFAFKTAPTNPGVSERYVQATTIDVIHDMAKLGWLPVVAKQCRNKSNSKGIRSYHMIAFQNPNIKVMKDDNEVEAFPRIILTNSHDGFNSFKFMVGLFRLVCSNGLVVADEEFGNMSIRHINYTFEELRKTVVAFVAKLPEQISVLNQMRKYHMTDEQKHAFAVEAIKLRKGYEKDAKVQISEETIEDVLTPVRKEDEGNSLWNVFNTIQEKIVKGNFHYSEQTKKPRKMRKITSIVKDLQINKELFNLANSYIKVAA